MKQSAEIKALEAVDRDDYRYGTFEYLVEKVMYSHVSVDPLGSDMLFAVFHQEALKGYETFTKIQQVKTFFVEAANKKLIKEYNHTTMLLFDKTLPVDKSFILGVVYKFNAIDFEGDSNYYNFPFSIKEFAQSEDYDLLATLLPHFDFKAVLYEDLRYSKVDETKIEFVRLADFIIPADEEIQNRLYQEIVVKQLYKQNDLLTHIHNANQNDGKEPLENTYVLGDNIINEPIV
jgi:hypothetical protein